MSILKYVITFLYNIEKHQANILTLILYYIPLKKTHSSQKFGLKKLISGKSTFPSVEISYCKQVPICTIYFAIVATI